MALDALRSRMPELASECLRLIRRGPNGNSGVREEAPPSRCFITPEEFQEELIILGLSGKTFVPQDYVSALSCFLGISISVHVIPDVDHPELARQLALSGRLGEVRYSDDLRLAAILVPESLPHLVFDLTVFHELGHLAAGDLLVPQRPDEGAAPVWEADAARLPTVRVRRERRIARGMPFAAEAAREHEANLRASYAFTAGCLGEESPYVHGMYQVL